MHLHPHRIWFTFSILIVTLLSTKAQPLKKRGRPLQRCDISDTSLIKGRTDFSNCKFIHAEFNSAGFKKKANFDHCLFTAYADFDEIDADSGISIINSKFLKGFDIYRLLLPKTYFDSTAFSGDTRFERVSFDTLASFRSCAFNGKTSFIDMGFDKADFSHLKFSDSSTLNFHNCTSNVLDFSFNPHIPSEIRLVDGFDFDPTVIDNGKQAGFGRCLINLYRSDVSKFYLTYRSFKLYFPAYRDSTGNVDSTEISNNEKRVIYEALLNNFKVHGQSEDYQLLDIEYQTFKYQSEGKWLTYLISRYWWNFGYDKEYVFYWSLSLILLFSLINLCCIEQLTTVVYSGFQSNGPIAYPAFVPLRNGKDIGRNTGVLLIRFWYAFVFSCTLFFFVNIKLETINYQKVIGTLYIFLIYLSGLVCLAYIANFILQK